MKRIRLTQGWQFWKENEDDNRRRIDLPHDAMLHEKRDPSLPKGNMSGFFPGGRYYYEKHIYGEEAFADQTVLLKFEGVYMNASILLNGEKIGERVYGFSDFFVDLTDKLMIGQDNCITVIADNSHTPNCRWYTGSGIYRNVWFWTGARQHFEPDGIRVTTVSVNPPVIDVEIRAGGEKSALESLTEPARSQQAREERRG